MRLFWLLGMVLGAVVCLLVGAFLFKLQWWAGVEGKYPLLSLLTFATAVYAGRRFYQWFVAWEG